MGIVNFGLLSQIGSPSQIAQMIRTIERPGELARERRRELEAMQENEKTRGLQREILYTGQQSSEQMQTQKLMEARRTGALKYMQDQAEAEQKFAYDQALEEQKQQGRTALETHKSGLISPFQAGSLALRNEELGLEKQKFGLELEKDERQKPLDMIKVKQNTANLYRTMLGNKRSLLEYDKAERASKMAGMQYLSDFFGGLSGQSEDMQQAIYRKSKPELEQASGMELPETLDKEQKAAFLIGSTQYNQLLAKNPIMMTDLYSKEGREAYKKLVFGQMEPEQQLSALEAQEKQQSTPEGTRIRNSKTGEEMVWIGGTWMSDKDLGGHI